MGGASVSGSNSDAAERLVARLLVSDENGSWAIVEEALAGGAAPRNVYVDLFGPALRMIGDLWARGAITVADSIVHRWSSVGWWDASGRSSAHGVRGRAR